MSGLVHRFPSGSFVDHVAIAVPDLHVGCDRVEAAVDITAFRMPSPEPGQWYHSAGVPLGGGQLLEIIGPNHTADAPEHPARDFLTAIEQPFVWFWYVRTDHLDALTDAARTAGLAPAPIDDVDHDNPALSSYRRCALDPTGDLTMPQAISWRHRRAEFADDQPARIPRWTLQLAHPRPSERSALLAELGIRTDIVEAALPTLALTLQGRGQLTIDSAGRWEAS